MNILYYIIIEPLFWISIFFSISILCIGKLYEAEIIGWFGEFWTKQELYRLSSKNYKILNNILIRVKDKTFQMDHIVVSKYGIFVIETKQYNGYITGSKYDARWIRHYGDKEFNCLNPIRQNYNHILALAELLNLDKSKFINIVCIPSKAHLNIQHDGELVRNYTLVERLLSYQDELAIDVDEVAMKIKCANIKDSHIRKEHIKRIRNFANNQNNICPKCGGMLILREGYNVFWGCSNYPKCKYIRKV